MRKVLCVCHGNMGRSPMMEAFLRNSLRNLGIEDIRVESAGVAKEYEGNASDENVVAEMRARGIACDSHRSRHMGSVGDLKDFGLIVCVSEKEAQQVIAWCPAIASRIHITPVAENWGEDIEEACRKCADYIERQMGKLALRIASGELPLD